MKLMELVFAHEGKNPLLMVETSEGILVEIDQYEVGILTKGDGEVVEYIQLIPMRVDDDRGVMATIKDEDGTD